MSALTKYEEVRRRIQRLKRNIYISSHEDDSHPLDPLTEQDLAKLRQLVGIYKDYFICIQPDGTKQVKVIFENGEIQIIDLSKPEVIKKISTENKDIIEGVVSGHGKIREEFAYVSNKNDIEYTWIPCVENKVADEAIDRGLSKKYDKITDNTMYHIYARVNNGPDLGIMAAYSTSEGVVKAVIKSEYCPTNPIDIINETQSEEKILRIVKSTIYWEDWEFKYNRDYDHGLILYEIKWKDKLICTRLGLILQESLYQPLDPQYIWANRHTTPIPFGKGKVTGKSELGHGISISDRSNLLTLTFTLYHPFSNIVYTISYIFTPNGKLELKTEINGKPELRCKPNNTSNDTSSVSELFGAELGNNVIPYVQYTIAWRITLETESTINKVIPSRIKINETNPYGNAIVWAKYPVTDVGQLGKKRGEYWEVSNIQYMIKPMITDTDMISKPAKDIELDGRALIVRTYYVTNPTVKYGLNGMTQLIIAPY